MATPNEGNTCNISSGLFDAALAAGRALGVPIELGDSTPAVVVPTGYKLENLEALGDVPRRIRAKPEFRTAASFSHYLNAHRNASTHLFGDVTETGARFEALLDYHHEGKAVWTDHRAGFTAQLTPDWRRWMEKDRKEFGQVDFAHFIENNLLLFTSPVGAELLEMVLKLEGKADVRFKSSVRLDNGQHQLMYEEDIEMRGGAASSKPGELRIPAEFIIVVSPFEGMPAQRVAARLRYRIREGKIVFWYETQQPHEIIRTAAIGLQVAIESATDLTCLQGKP